jgi:hypothetical protein
VLPGAEAGDHASRNFAKLRARTDFAERTAHPIIKSGATVVIAGLNGARISRRGVTIGDLDRHDFVF